MDDYIDGTDSLADELRRRNWTDWRPPRFKPFTHETVAAALEGLARTIKTSMKELDAIITVAASKADSKHPLGATVALQEEGDHAQIQGLAVARPQTAYFLPEARSDGEFDKVHYDTVRRDYSYYAYTRRFDEVVIAKDLTDESELMRLYSYVVKSSGNLFSNYKSELEKLSAIIAGRKVALSLSVTLLIDNSGSMRGRPIVAAASTALMLVEWLERWGVRTEVLGYTTRAWKGGMSRELWLADKRPDAPGRLNDIRHIVYKSFDESANASGPNIGVMMREGILKENFDGEALLWACSRLVNEKTNNKYLFVFSDGAPVDDSTFAQNSGNYLDRHLSETVKTIEDKSDINLIAVGIGGYQSAKYSKSFKVPNDEELGFSVLQTLHQVFINGT